MADWGNIAIGATQGMNQGLHTIAELQQIKHRNDQMERENNLYQLQMKQLQDAEKPFYFDGLEQKLGKNTFNYLKDQYSLTGQIYKDATGKEYTKTGQVKDFAKMALSSNDPLLLQNKIKDTEENVASWQAKLNSGEVKKPEDLADLQMKIKGQTDLGNQLRQMLPKPALTIVPKGAGVLGPDMKPINTGAQTPQTESEIKADLTRRYLNGETLPERAKQVLNLPDASSKDSVVRQFEIANPDWKGKQETDPQGYAKAFQGHLDKIQANKIQVSVQGATARGAAYANERFYSMFDTSKGQTVKIKGNAINSDSSGRYLDPQDPNVKADTGSLAKITKGMDSVGAFEKGATQALDFTQKVAQDFGLGKYPKANSVSQLFQYHTGDPKVKGLQNAITTAATEYMKVINAGSDLTAAELSVMGQQRAKEIIQASDNFDSLKNSIQIMKREMQISGDKFHAQQLEIKNRLKNYGVAENAPAQSGNQTVIKYDSKGNRI